ncbi:amino acid adenylation domain-containing protein [Nitrosomonas nitrosa]|uniref:amino acid adenylation domain-containing protein n=1 Tax=Nitrosomonas nitrosa TaxID=52442 RepID=UPI0023F8C8DA|nr:amino acid adenylation domain-containing protein [Nitrosomonas nitrosa]MCO6433519.1 amino acid adenylation domain-containing protein [Nitrosomonas nitrosa]
MTNNLDLAQRRARLTPEQRQRLAQRLQAAGKVAQQTFVIPRRLANERVYLSYAQQRHWFLWQLDPHSNAYHLGSTLRLTGQLNKPALEKSFQILVARHESLRTVFRANAQGLPEQIIEPAGRFKLTVTDLRDVPTALRASRAREEAIRIHTTPFDLTQGPLLRVVLLQVEPEEHHLVVVMHHIISDAWSNRIIIDEFAACYRAHCEGQQAVIPPLSIQYADYANWQRSWLEAGEKERQLAYWRSQLGETHPVLQLPTDHPRPSTSNYRAAHYDFILPSSLIERLQWQMKTRGMTLFMGLLAGFQALLYRYTGQSDIRVGVPVANRHRVETENLVGCLVNTQVLCNRIDGHIPLERLLAQTRDAALGAQAYQDLPFEQLVEALQPERNLNLNPLFQVMFNHLREDYRALAQLPGLTVEEHAFDEQGAQFELSLDTVERPDGRVEARFTYAAELFEQQTVKRMGEHYLRLLDQLAQLTEQPARCLGDIILLSETEQAQLKAWGINEYRCASAEPVHRLIERQALLRPNATALIFGDTELSYAQLNRRANRLAHRLIALGIQPESRVGIAVERSIDMIVGLLAILKAGGAYVPLDPDYPRERLQYMVMDSGIGLLLTQQAIEARIPHPAHGNVLLLDTLDLDDTSDDNPAVALHGEHLAYIIYTSGSTGQPKGVAVAHHALVEHALIAVEFFKLNSADRMLQFSTINFDGFIEQLFPPLCVGAAIVLRGPVLWDSETLYQELIAKRITVADLTTAYWFLLVQDFARQGPRDYGVLRQVHAGGEAMSPEGIKAWRQAGLSGVALLNTYGPTEAIVTATVADCGGEAQGDQQEPDVSIGKPLPARHIYLLDANLMPVAPGIAGELYIGGELLARGYLNRPGLTAERFVADPFDSKGGRLYRTGDLARWREDGQIEYLGRVDHQVKIRGFRIELGEIETQLLQQPAVREAVVVAKEGPSGTRLVAYVSLHAEHAASSPSTLREALAQSLPDYMLPSAIVVLDNLPLNANGKVDRKRLPEPEFVSEGDYAAPEGEVEQVLANIWVEVLGMGRVGRNDNFFELGGHSLAILQVQQKLHLSLSISVPLRLFFEQPILKAIATVIREEYMSVSRKAREQSELSEMAELLDILEN